MLLIINKMSQLNFAQLMWVYNDSNRQSGKVNYPKLNDGQSLLETEQDHYAFLQAFFKIPGAFLAVWEQDGAYRCSLRVEPYMDGFLLEGLETAPDSRRKGFAKRLIDNVTDYLSEKGPCKLYSHVDKTNTASIKVHEACHFEKLYDHAVFVDCSVDHHTFTYMKKA